MKGVFKTEFIHYLKTNNSVIFHSSSRSYSLSHNIEVVPKWNLYVYNFFVIFVACVAITSCYDVL